MPDLIQQIQYDPFEAGTVSESTDFASSFSASVPFVGYSPKQSKKLAQKQKQAQKRLDVLLRRQAVLQQKIGQLRPPTPLMQVPNIPYQPVYQPIPPVQWQNQYPQQYVAPQVMYPPNFYTPAPDFQQPWPTQYASSGYGYSQPVFEELPAEAVDEFDPFAGGFAGLGASVIGAGATGYTPPDSSAFRLTSQPQPVYTNVDFQNVSSPFSAVDPRVARAPGSFESQYIGPARKSADLAFDIYNRVMGKPPAQFPMYKPPSDSSWLLPIGLGALALVGGIAYLVLKKKSRR